MIIRTLWKLLEDSIRFDFISTMNIEHIYPDNERIRLSFYARFGKLDISTFETLQVTNTKTSQK